MRYALTKRPKVEKSVTNARKSLLLMWQYFNNLPLPINLANKILILEYIWYMCLKPLVQVGNIISETFFFS